MAAPSYGDGLKPSETGWSAGWAHESNPVTGPPFNNKPELVVDTFGGGRYWDWGNTEFHIWLGIKRDAYQGQRAWKPAAEFMVLRKWRKR